MRENTSPRANRELSAARRAASNAGPAKGAKTGYAMKKKKPVARKARRRSGPVLSDNVKTALWLWCPPVGLMKMWRSSCTWHRGVKIGITAAMAAILVAIFVIPTPDTAKFETGVQMVADKPEVEVYGPALPAVILPGFARENTGSIIVDDTASDVHYVYAADGAECYHEYECKFAFASSQRLTVYEAYHLGFRPCGRCNPPVYVPGQTDPITAQPLQSTAVITAAESTQPDDDTTAEPEATEENPS